MVYISVLPAFQDEQWQEECRVGVSVADCWICAVADVLVWSGLLAFGGR